MVKMGILQDLHPSVKLLFAILVSLFCAFVMITVGTLLALPFTGADFASLIEQELNLADPAHLSISKYFQLLSHLGMFIIPSIILAWLYGGSTSKYLFADSKPGSLVLLFSVALVFTMLPLINFTHELNMRLDLPPTLQWFEDWMRQSEDSAQKATTAFLSVETIQGLLFNLFLIAVIPAIGEEFIFRGVLLRIFGQWLRSPHFAVWVTAIIFSAIHMQFYGFLPRLLLGAMFGYLVIFSGSIWPAVIAHFVNNAGAIIVFYLKHNNISGSALNDLGKGAEGYFAAIAGLLLTVAIFWFIIRKNRSRAIHEL